MEPRNQQLTTGQRVRIIIDPPAGTPAEGVIRIIQDEPGKEVGVELDRLTDGAHSLDGLVEERTDPVRGITVGKGWWTVAENLEIL